MGAPDILGRLAEAGVRLSAHGDRLRAEPADRLTDELRTLIRANKPALLARLGGHVLDGEAVENDAEAFEERAAIIAEGCKISQAEATERAMARPIPLADVERATLDRRAVAWGMDGEDRAVMYRQCERGAELEDGSWLSPEEARAFWLAEAGAIH